MNEQFRRAERTRSQRSNRNHASGMDDQQVCFHAFEGQVSQPRGMGGKFESAHGTAMSSIEVVERSGGCLSGYCALKLLVGQEHRGFTILPVVSGQQRTKDTSSRLGTPHSSSASLHRHCSGSPALLAARFDSRPARRACLSLRITIIIIIVARTRETASRGCERELPYVTLRCW